MKNIKAYLIGTTNYDYTLVPEIQMQGVSSVQKAIILSQFYYPTIESVPSGVNLYTYNFLQGLSVTDRKTKYTLVGGLGTITAGNAVSSKTIQYISANGVTVNTASTPSYVVVDSRNLLFAVSKFASGSAGNCLLYMRGIDPDNSKDFIVYEVASTLNALYTLLTT